MVRRVASQNLGTVAEAAVKVGGREAVDGTVAESIVVGTLLPLYEELAANTQPVSVKGSSFWSLHIPIIGDRGIRALSSLLAAFVTHIY